jgi:hypothetical protein
MAERPTPEPVVRTIPASQANEPKVRKVGAAPATQAAPAPVREPEVKRRKIMRPVKDDEGNIDYDSIPSGKEFKDKDGSVYKFVDNPNFDPDKAGSKPRAKMKITAQNGAGIKRAPPPDKNMLEMYSAQQSGNTVSKFNMDTGMAANHGMPSPGKDY